MPITHTRHKKQTPEQLQFPACLQKLASPGKSAAGYCFCLFIGMGLRVKLILLSNFVKVGQKSVWLWEVMVRGKKENGHNEQEWAQMRVLSRPLFSRPDMHENRTVETTSQCISARLTSDRRHQGHRDYGWAVDGTKRVSDALSMRQHPLTHTG